MAVALALSGPVAAQSLKEAVTIAIETNPQVVSAAKRKDAADSAIDAAKGGYYPRVDFLLGTGEERSQNQATNQVWRTLSRKQESAILNQMIWDGYGVKSEVDRRKAISDSSAHRAYGTAEEVALQTIEAYLDVLKNRELLGYAKDNLGAHQKTYDQVKLRADKGVGRRADLDQIDARLALAVSNVASAESTLRDSEIAYQRVVGRAPVTPSMPALPNIPRTVDEAVKVGIENHPVLKSAQSDVDAAQAQREIAKSFFSPRLEFEASYSNNRKIDGVDAPDRDRMAMLWLKWNVFRGGFDKYRSQETAHQINEAQEIARNTHRQVEAAVRLAYNAFATARDRLPSLERYVKSSDSTRDAYAKQFAIGQRTLLDLLDSENEYFTARSTYLNGKFIEASARYRVLNAMGQLLLTLDVRPPEQAIVKAPE
jgi:adhesin transport system outer membrane protein